jgi:hypothetical protein
MLTYSSKPHASRGRRQLPTIRIGLASDLSLLGFASYGGHRGRRGVAIHVRLPISSSRMPAKHRAMVSATALLSARCAATSEASVCGKKGALRDPGEPDPAKPSRLVQWVPTAPRAASVAAPSGAWYVGANSIARVEMAEAQG